MGAFKKPHDGELKDHSVDPTAAEADKQAARDYAPWGLTKHRLCETWTPDTKAEAQGVCGSADGEHAPRHEQGFTVLFTGLSGSGKSTMANALMSKITEVGDRQISLLDGDIVRKNFCSELGFSAEYRDLNLQRIGLLAGEITRSDGIAIRAPIAPHASIRKKVREAVAAVSAFVEIHEATPFAVCQERDSKGLCALTRAGKIKQLTGTSDPYEAPESAEMVIDSVEVSPDPAAHRILVKLESMGSIQ